MGDGSSGNDFTKDQYGCVYGRDLKSLLQSYYIHYLTHYLEVINKPSKPLDRPSKPLDRPKNLSTKTEEIM